MNRLCLNAKLKLYWNFLQLATIGLAADENTLGVVLGGIMYVLSSCWECFSLLGMAIGSKPLFDCNCKLFLW